MEPIQSNWPDPKINQIIKKPKPSFLIKNNLMEKFSDPKSELLNL